MQIIPHCPILSHDSRVFRRKVLSILSWERRLTSNFRAMNYQLNAIKMKSNRSLVTRIAAGTADANDITVAYRTLSYLFDAFLVSCIYDIQYYANDRLRWILRSKLGLIRMKSGLQRKGSFWWVNVYILLGTFFLTFYTLF